MDIEVELKEERPLIGTDYTCLCDAPATRMVVIGRIENRYGTEFSICPSEDCLDRAMQNYIDELEYIRGHRKELAQIERFEYERENKNHV